MRIAVERLKTISIALLRSLGTDPDEAKLVTESLILADMRGIPTHGVNFLPMIAERIQCGLLRVPTELNVISDEGALTHLDGGNGLGQVSASEGMRQAVAKARKFGVALSLVRNTNHIGLLAFYSSMAVTDGMLGICMCNSAAAMAPWGGAEPFFGTNPLSISVPSGNSPSVVLDMSTSVAARGKIRRALKMKEQLLLVLISLTMEKD